VLCNTFAVDIDTLVIVATGLFASAPDAVAHGGLGEGAVVVAAATAAEAFTAGVSGTFTAIAVFSTMIDFSFPVSVSMGTRGGGIGVIPIIGVIRITLTITQITRAHTTVTMRTTAIRITKPVMPALPLRRRSKPNSPGAATIEAPLTAS
jgi:hypothetical protein